MEDKRSFFGMVFTALMMFTALTWVCTVAFIMSWPWVKDNPQWKPEFRLVATCADTKEPCGIAWEHFAEARAKGTFSSLEPAEPAGEIEEERNWLKWKKENGVYEVKASSWHFQTAIRYRIENDQPVLVAYQDVEATAFYYGVGVALFMLLGLNLRKLRQ